MKLRHGRALGHHVESDTIRDRDQPFYSGNMPHDVSGLCASGDKCVESPARRVEIRGEQCASCLRVQREMRARLRARR